jgi:hypothetical protein
MAKRKSAKSSEKFWTEGLDKAAVEEALEDATVDSNGVEEQHSGLLTMVEQELDFPFKARVLGDEVSIVGMEWPERDEFGLDLLVEKNGQKHRIEARSVQLVKPLPEGHLYLAAFFEWQRGI